MAYNNYGNRGSSGGSSSRYSSDDNVSTTGVSFSNDTIGKCLLVNYWGRNVTFEIGSFVAGSHMTWEVRKNMQTLKQVVSFQHVADLAILCDDIADSIKSSGTFTSAGIRCGSKMDSILEISNGENIGMPFGVYLVIYKGLDNSNRTNVLEFYQFEGTKIIRGYDHNTGSYKTDISKMGEFKKFIKTLHAAAEAFTMAQAHTIAEVKKNDKMAAFRALSAMSAALGVDVSKDLLTPKKTSGSSTYTRNQNPSGGPGGYQKSSGYGNRNYQGRSGGYNAPRGGNNYSNNSTTFENPNMTYQAALASIGDDPVDLNLDVSQLQGVELSKFPQ